MNKTCLEEAISGSKDNRASGPNLNGNLVNTGDPRRSKASMNGGPGMQGHAYGTSF